MDQELIRSLPLRPGHFRYESGHHGEQWLDLERLFLEPAPLVRCALKLARKLLRYRVEMVCGPLVEGAFVALQVALELGVPFAYSERFENPGKEGLFPVDYRLPRALRGEVKGRRVAVINDVTNAGSAVRGTLADLLAFGAHPTVIGTLVVLGTAADQLARDHGLTLQTLARLPNPLWTPEECPLCAKGTPLSDQGAEIPV